MDSISSSPLKQGYRNFRDPIRIVPFTSFIGISAVLWDSWWHGVVGRESFFIPPHDLLYASLGIGFLAVAAHIRAERRRGKKTDRRLLVSFVAHLVIFASAPFDELWHRTFGREALASVFALWSPPHLAALLASIVSGLAVYRLVTDRFPKLHLLHLLQAAAVFTAAQFVLLPFMPVGLHRVLGWYGTFFLSLVSAPLLIFFARRSPLAGTATLVSLLYFALISSAQLGEGAVPVISIPPHAHAPPWLVYGSILLGGLIIDAARRRLPHPITGFLYGLLPAAMFYPVASSFIPPAFWYGSDAAAIAVAAESLGGLAGGLVASAFLRKQ